jgi:hypothetical protein
MRSGTSSSGDRDAFAADHQIRVGSEALRGSQGPTPNGCWLRHGRLCARLRGDDFLSPDGQMGRFGEAESECTSVHSVPDARQGAHGADYRFLLPDLRGCGSLISRQPV